MDGVTEGAVTGEAAGSTGGEGAELTNGGVTGATGADQGGEGGQGGAAAGEGGGAEGGAGGEGGEGEGSGATKVEPKDDDVNKRFSKVTRERDEATRREREANENLRRALEALERANGGKKEATTAPTTPTDDIGAEPEPPQFEDPEQYQRDMAEYTRKMVERTTKLQLKEAETKRATENAEKANREAALEHGRTWMARREKALEKYHDYADVAENNALHISNDMAVAITSSEHGADIAYYLGQHPELAERISKMRPAMQLMEMGKLEAQITAPKPVKTSKTPEPIKIDRGSGEPQVKSADEMSMEEYAAQRNKRH